MVRWPINAHPIIVMAAIAIGLNRILIGIDNLIAIGSDHILIGVGSGFEVGFGGGLFDQFHLAMLGYQPQQSVQQLRQEAFRAISQEGFTSYYNSDLTLL
jgi:hypothetical protein